MKKSFCFDSRGVAAIELAIVLPVLMLIFMAIIEFGLYFLKEQAASRAVSTASNALQQSPLDATIKLSMEKNGLGMMNLAQAPNFVCAKAYSSVDAANAGSCTSGEWLTDRPADAVAGATYYVFVRAFAVHTPLTPLRDMTGTLPPDIDSKNIIPISSTSSSWVDVPLTDTAPFDYENCQYRFKLSGQSYPWGGFSANANYDGIYQNADVVEAMAGIFIRAVNKRIVYVLDLTNNNVANVTAAWGWQITKLQKKCG